jgi:two-component system sensor histidine kinase DesK
VSAATGRPIDLSAWTPARLRWLLVAVHVVVIGIPIVLISFSRLYPATASVGFTVVAGLALLALQLRHSLATARGTRPAGWGWSMLAMAAVVYLPLHWFGNGWRAQTTLLVASAFMLLRGWPAIVVGSAPIVSEQAYVLFAFGDVEPPGVIAYGLFYNTIASVMVAATLYGSARVVGVLAELQASRTELAELAVGRERLQIARNLHDLLGQSLSAISLKGDLALGLLRRDPLAARAEIESISDVARNALRGVRAVAHDQHTTTVRTELDGAVALLDAAGIDVHLDMDLPDLPPATEEALAWTIREGVTNVLRHSQATTCSITATSPDDVRLEVVNDGAYAPASAGSGLTGITERVHALGGTVTVGPLGDGHFRLLVEIPEPVG